MSLKARINTGYLQPTDKFTKGPIAAIGTFVYQLAIPEEGSGKPPCNLWSGRIDPNNGFYPMYAQQAVALFVAAPDMVALLKQAVARVELANMEGNPILSAWAEEAKQLLEKIENTN